MFEFFWVRTPSVWIAGLYILLGLGLLAFPGTSGTLFVWMLAAGTTVYALAHLARYWQGRRAGRSLPGDLFLTVLPLAFSVFALLWPSVILSFLPLVLGSLLLIDGVGKLPLALAALRQRGDSRVPLTLACLIPLVLGVLILVNPFHTARLVIMVFGAALVLDGVSDLGTCLTEKHSPPPSR